MAVGSRATTDASQYVLNLTRDFNAPRNLMFKAWSRREHWMQWWGPTGFVVLECELDFRVGGAWRIAMKSPEGRIDRQQGVFRDISEPERIVFTYAFVDDHGAVGHEMIVAVSFEELGGKTRLNLHQAIFESIQLQREHIDGWHECFDNLDQELAKLAA